MYIYNLIFITLITAPSLRSPLPLLSLQFFLVRLTFHVHGVGLWAVEILTAHIASVASGWGRLTGRVFSVGRLVWLVFNCKRQMTSYKDYDYDILFFWNFKGQLNDKFRNTNSWTTSRMLSPQSIRLMIKNMGLNKQFDIHQN